LKPELGRNSGSAVSHRQRDSVAPRRHRDPDPALPVHRLRRIDQQVQDRRANHLRVGLYRRLFTVDGDLHVLGNRITPDHRHRLRGERAKFDVAESQRAGTGKHHDVVDQLAEGIDPADDVAHHREFGVPARPPRHQDLHRPLDAGERVADFVGHDCRHLSQSRQCGLLGQLLLSRLACRDVRPDGDVLIGFAALVREGNDGRVDPVVVAVFGAIADFAVPDLAVGDRPPQLAHELLRVILGVDDPVVAADQLVARIARDLAELVVHVGDEPGDVGDRHDRGVVESAFQVFETRCVCHRDPE